MGDRTGSELCFFPNPNVSDVTNKSLPVSTLKIRERHYKEEIKK